MKEKFLWSILMVTCLALLAGCAANESSGTVIGSAVINAPAEKISKFMCNMSDAEMKEVFSIIKERKNMQGIGCAIGNSEDQVQCALGQCFNLHMVWTDIVPNQLYQLKYTGDAHGTTSYVFSPEAKGTRLTVIMEVGGRLPLGLSYDTVKSMFEKSIDDSLAVIKSKVEK